MLNGRLTAKQIQRYHLKVAFLTLVHIFSKAYGSYVVRHKKFTFGQITDNQMESEGRRNSDGVGKEARKSLVLNQSQSQCQCQCQRDQPQEEGRVTGGKEDER